MTIEQTLFVGLCPAREVKLVCTFCIASDFAICFVRPYCDSTIWQKVMKIEILHSIVIQPLLCVIPAVRDFGGYYYLNGNWKISVPGKIKIAGTMFSYDRKPHHSQAPEVLAAAGPTNAPIVIVVSQPAQYHSSSLVLFMILYPPPPPPPPICFS